ncbi:MAG: flagellar hook basal-body protein [Armatimonadetes bacterium]|nr:flagellar hook basal-body protein [Armatimonadota bacterium]
MFDMNYQVNAIMQNQQMLNTYFNNMQNQFTPGYKAENLSFTDILGQQMAGKGAKTKSSGIVFTQGQIFQTQIATNLAINGNGFFAVSDGVKTHYTRDGRFNWNNGELVNPEGKKVMGFELDASGNIVGDAKPIKLEVDPATGLMGGKYSNLRFDENGTLYGQQTETDPLTDQSVTKEVPIAQVALGSFANAGGLTKTGNTTFGETDTSGKVVLGVAGQGSLGKVAPGSLEMSNVDFAQQAAAIGMAKQNYEANFAAFRAMDKLTEQAIGLIR